MMGSAAGCLRNNRLEAALLGPQPRTATCQRHRACPSPRWSGFGRKLPAQRCTANILAQHVRCSGAASMGSLLLWLLPLASSSAAQSPR